MRDEDLIRQPTEIQKAVGKLMADTLDAIDDVQQLTDEELGRLLQSGRWTTVEVHEAARRLVSRARLSGAENPE